MPTINAAPRGVIDAQMKALSTRLATLETAGVPAGEINDAVSAYFSSNPMPPDMSAKVTKLEQDIQTKAGSSYVEDMWALLETKQDADAISSMLSEKADKVQVTQAIAAKATMADIQSEISKVVGNAPSDLNTITKLSDRLQQESALVASMSGTLASKVTAQDVQQSISSKADKSDIPLPSTTTPPAVAAKSARGNSARFALADHTHEETVKFAATNQETNTSGVWSLRLPAGRFTNPPAIFCTVKNPTGSYDYRASVSGLAAEGFLVTVTFTKRKDSVLVNLPAVVIGAAAQNIAAAAIEIGSAIGKVTFDMLAAEPTV